jgi:hypothetical protein
LQRFVIECIDVNLHMLERGRELAEREGMAGTSRASKAISIPGKPAGATPAS